MIKTERLLLRAPQNSDLAALFTIFSDPRAMRYWSRPPHENPEITRKTLEEMVASHRETGAEYVVEYQGQVIGKAGSWRIGEIGYILHPDFWQRGFAFEALAAIIPQVFANCPDISEIRAEIDPRNQASNRLLSKLGFHKTGDAERTLEIAGIWVDSAYYARPRS
ncbi:MAG: GNAT family N-acetyltransferase [Rhodobacteraceae bacterium]|nr:GNAT family N-acetyltransferase [Paracoccaceae bacterium]